MNIKKIMTTAAKYMFLAFFLGLLVAILCVAQRLRN